MQRALDEPAHTLVPAAWMKDGDRFAGMRVLLPPRLRSCPFKVVCLFCLSCWDLPNHSSACRQASSKRSPEYYLTQKVDPRRKKTLWQWPLDQDLLLSTIQVSYAVFFIPKKHWSRWNRHSKYCHSHFIIAILKTVLITFLFQGWENWSSLMIWTLTGKQRTSQAK
jgi:hypothetical protein